eukprot:CAMPEP_0183713884 /NCGR_PEP_ID=MMETSP0737-20130205/8619_1 /TAXON_ID=385413 /ORGANISM="Thalassiosira miniscula, Strain CCMP1093" /LENGTH=314 /DNA_ID=CAMNT_0025942747 /DNA_START=50 /DNA_END=994 /DNA_ORIENTATION=+
MAIIGGRRAFAAYATTISVRATAAFSVYPSLSPGATGPAVVRPLGQTTVFPHQRTIASNFAMSSTSSDADTKVDIASNISLVRQRMEDAMSSNDRPAGSVRLVAVSKTKPLELLQAAYESGQRYFGENYAQELMAKSTEMPDDVSWHFIGPLQSNKAAPLVKTVGLDKLACIETVSTLKLSAKLNRAVETLNEDTEEKKKLGIYLQVNTSGEESKSGLTPGREVSDLAKQITEECPWLSIDGLMTIGAPGDYSCFDSLVQCREEVATVLGKEPKDLELSMGMSGDFEVAIAKGATSVRVGSTIFGERDYSNLKK